MSARHNLMRTCVTCGEHTAHRLADEQPNVIHVRGARHQAALTALRIPASMAAMVKAFGAIASAMQTPAGQEVLHRQRNVAEYQRRLDGARARAAAVA